MVLLSEAARLLVEVALGNVPTLGHSQDQAVLNSINCIHFNTLPSLLLALEPLLEQSLALFQLEG